MHMRCLKGGVGGSIWHLKISLDGEGISTSKHLAAARSALVTLAREPAQWKGGLLVDLYKGAGPTNQCSSSRGILVADSIGKHVRRAYRRRLVARSASEHAD